MQSHATPQATRYLTPPDSGEVVRISAGDAREELATIVSQVAFAKCRYVIERHRRGLVAIVPVEDLELLRRFSPQGLERARTATPRRRQV